MNEKWIEHSHDSAECCRDDFLDNGFTDLNRFEYLDTMGLFETSWMIYRYHSNIRGYGYPNDE